MYIKKERRSTREKEGMSKGKKELSREKGMM